MKRFKNLFEQEPGVLEPKEQSFTKSPHGPKKKIAEQHREKGRFKPTIPHNVPSVLAATPKKMNEDFGKPTPSAEEVAKKHGVSIDVINQQLKIGIKVETEHTNDTKMAREIALDHLNEKPNYYTKLKKYVEMTDVEYQSAGTGARTLIDKPNKEPMKTYKQLKKEEIEQLDEISPELKARYKEKAEKTVKEVEPWTKKGEYKDLAKNLIKRRQRGLAMVKEQNDTQEKNEMVESQLHFIKYACKEIIDYMKMGGKIEEWYQVKVAKVFSDFESLHAYMEGESRRLGMKEETQYLDEMDKSQPTPGRDERISHSTYGSRDTKGSDYFKGKERPAKPISRKQMGKDALEILKKQGLAEETEVEHSTVRNLARMALKKQAENMKPVKESLHESRKAEIVKEIMKKKKNENDNSEKFQKDPELSSEITKA